MTESLLPEVAWMAGEPASARSRNKSNRKTLHSNALQPFLYNAIPLTPESLVIFKVPVLKALAQYYGLKYGGTKAQLIERLVAFGDTQASIGASMSLVKNGVGSLSCHDPFNLEFKYKSEVILNSPQFSSVSLFPFYSTLHDIPLFINCLCRGDALVYPSSVIQCSDCGTQFHERCMNLAMENKLWNQRSIFVCPNCRFRRMDPFHPVVELQWMTYVHPAMAEATVDAENDSYCVFLSFTLDAKNLHLWKRSNQHVIVRCIRLYSLESEYELVHHEWPQTVTIKVNEHVESIAAPRPDHKRRDSPMFLTHYLRPSQNPIQITISATWVALKTFPIYALAVVLCDSIDVSQLMKNICDRTDYSYQQAIDRVISLVNFKNEDEEVLCVENVYRFKLTCPITLTRLVIPARGKHCKHLQCFDLESFIYVTKASKAFNNRWKCPECSLVVRPDMLVKDLFVSHILEQTHESAGDLVEVFPGGQWKLFPSTLSSPLDQMSPSPHLHHKNNPSKDNLTVLENVKTFKSPCHEGLTLISLGDSDPDEQFLSGMATRLSFVSAELKNSFNFELQNSSGEKFSHTRECSLDPDNNLECIDLSSTTTTTTTTTDEDDQVQQHVKQRRINEESKLTMFRSHFSDVFRSVSPSSCHNSKHQSSSSHLSRRKEKKKERKSIAKTKKK